MFFNSLNLLDPRNNDWKSSFRFAFKWNARFFLECCFFRPVRWPVDVAHMCKCSNTHVFWSSFKCNYQIGCLKKVALSIPLYYTRAFFLYTIYISLITPSGRNKLDTNFNWFASLLSNFYSFNIVSPSFCLIWFGMNFKIENRKFIQFNTLSSSTSFY